ncbi:FMN-dependent NADH-azoreductase [Natronobacillus azotifigens]|uniref:FMN dependent NADH:quinone oxidoreductase n=1 Tax=Natronobacillus azotifigens TaxID=472978 RepID=A0A9J6RFV1_9BACI|nr:FMN-dependent NADH-azoreductase [Natronobacillus azotifigens]MCZ0704642.1 FMN-dependent NADH-azoreductase [Natronobacillus azotifigens]
MTTVLYITANPNDASVSHSIATGEHFIQAYQKTNPDHEIVPIDLYGTHIPQIDAEVFQGWGKLQSGSDFTSLTEPEKKKIYRLEELCNQFIKADKYVFVSPLWNLSIPPVLKAYIDAVAVAGKTFKHTEQGAVGLLHNKKALHIQASGGVYSHGPGADKEMGHRYIRTLLEFFGVTDVVGLFIEGHDQMPDRKEEIIALAKQQAEELAEKF